MGNNPHSVNIPWESNIETWPDLKELVECDNIVKLYNTIKDNNLPKYGEEYQKVVEGCNNKCKKSFKDYTKEANTDFPINEKEQNDTKEMIVQTNVI